jgi:uncharacterized membrane protein
MGLQSQVNSLIGSVSGAISGVAQAVTPTNADTIEETTKRLEKEKLARAKQKASMEKQRALFQEAKLRKIKAQDKLKSLKEDKNTISIGGEKIKDPNLIKKLKEKINDKK